MNKIIVVSHNRTATQSTKTFLTELGFKCAHWGGTFIKIPDADKMTKEELYTNLMKLTKDYDAFMDIPFNHMYKELYAEYPGSKILQIVRPANEWVKSIKNIYKAFEQDDIGAYLQHLVNTYIKNAPRKMSTITNEQLAYVHDSFVTDVYNYFYGRENFLQVDMHDPFLGNKIKNFLGKSDFSINFPQVDFYIKGINK